MSNCVRCGGEYVGRDYCHGGNDCNGWHEGHYSYYECDICGHMEYSGKTFELQYGYIVKYNGFFGIVIKAWTDGCNIKFFDINKNKWFEKEISEKHKVKRISWSGSAKDVRRLSVLVKCSKDYKEHKNLENSVKYIKVLEKELKLYDKGE